MRFAFIAVEKAEDESVVSWCRALRVSPSGYYAAMRRPESLHAREDRRLGLLVREAHDRSRKTYGSPRVHAELAAHGEQVSRKRVVRLMQEHELQARVRRRFKNTTNSDHQLAVAPNLLDRRFEAEKPNERWVGDTTELLIGETGKLYLAAILDLFSRTVVGWALSAVNDRHLVLRALEMALRHRCPDAGLLHHSDRGSPYASEPRSERTTMAGRGTPVSTPGPRRNQAGRPIVSYETLFVDADPMSRICSSVYFRAEMASRPAWLREAGSLCY